MIKPQHAQEIMNALGDHTQALQAHLKHSLQAQEAVHHNVMAQMSDVVKILSAPKRVIRDTHGRIAGIEPVIKDKD